jgi:hypothetical protein
VNIKPQRLGGHHAVWLTRVNCVYSPCVFQLRVEGRSSGASSSSSVLPPVWDRSCSTAQHSTAQHSTSGGRHIIWQSGSFNPNSPYKTDAHNVSSAADMHAAAYQSRTLAWKAGVSRVGKRWVYEQLYRGSGQRNIRFCCSCTSQGWTQGRGRGYACWSCCTDPAALTQLQGATLPHSPRRMGSCTWHTRR